MVNNDNKVKSAEQHNKLSCLLYYDTPLKQSTLDNNFILYRKRSLYLDTWTYILLTFINHTNCFEAVASPKWKL